MKDLSYRTAPLLNTLPAASAALAGVTVRLASDNKPYWCDGSTWIDLTTTYLLAPLVASLPAPSSTFAGGIARLAADNKPYWCDSNTWIDLSATTDSRLTTARMSTDVSNSSVTLSNATGLLIALAANSHYALEAKVIFQTAALTTGMTLTQAVPAGATVAAQWNIPTSPTASALSNQRTADTGTASTAIDMINANTLATASILVITGATAGHIQIRFASEVTASNVVIKAGSHLVATRVI